MADPQKIEKEEQKIVEQTLDASTDVSRVKADIDAFKKSVDDLNTEMADFEKTKSTFVKEIVEQKHKEFEARRLDIEKKRKEIQELIVKTRQDCDALKDEVLKSQARNELTQYEKVLLTIAPVQKKGWIATQRGALWNKEEWKNDKLSSFGRLAGFGLTGVGIVLGVRKLWNWTFGNTHEKMNYDDMSFKDIKAECEERDIAVADDAEKDDLILLLEEYDKTHKKKKKKKKSLWKRIKTLLKWGAIGTGIFYLGRGLFTGKWDFFGLGQEKKEGGGESNTPGANPENSKKEYAEKLSVEEKNRYNGFADHVNGFFDANAGTLPSEMADTRLGGSEMEDYQGEKIQGLVPFMFNNRYNHVSDILSENSFYYEVISSDAHNILVKMRTWTAGQLYGFLYPIASSLDNGINASLQGGFFSLLSSLKSNTAGAVDKMVDYLKGDEHAQKTIALAFRKGISVVTYLSSRRTRLQYQIVSDHLTQSDPKFASKPLESQLEDIKNALEDEEFVKTHVDEEIKSNFDDKGLYEVLGYLEQKKCLDSEVDPITASELEKTDGWKNEILDQDKDGDNILDRMKERTPEGSSLDKESTEEFSDILDGFDERVNSVGRQAWLNKHLPLWNMFDPEDQITQQLLRSGGYESLVKGFTDKIEVLRKKAQEGTLTSADITDLQKEIADYAAFEKSIKMSTLYVEKNFDENGNLFLRRGMTLWVAGQSMVSEIKMMIDKKDVTVDGILILGGAAVTLDITTYPVRWAISGGKAFSPSLRLTYRLGKFVVKSGLRLTGKTLEYSLRNRVPTWIGRYMYKGKDMLLKYELAYGNISLDKALKIAKFNEIRNGTNVISSKESLIRWAVGHASRDLETAEVELLIKYWDNPAVRKQLVDGKFVGKRWKIKDRSVYKHKYDFYLNMTNYQKLKDIHASLGRFTGTEAKIFSSMIQYATDLETAKQLLNNGIETKYLSYFEGSAKWISAEDFGRYLGRYSKQLKGKNIGQIIEFVKNAHASNKVTNSSIFVRNALRSVSSIEKYNTEAQKIAYSIYESKRALGLADNAIENFKIAEEIMKAKNLEEAKVILARYGIQDAAQVTRLTKDMKFGSLNKLSESIIHLNMTGYEKMAMKVKSGVNDMIKTLEGFAKNPKMKVFRAGFNNKIASLTEYVKSVTPESIKLIREGNSWLDVVTGFGSLSKEGIIALKNVRSLIAADTSGMLLKSLQAAKNVDEVKAALVQGGMTAEEVAKIDAKVLNKIASTKNAIQINRIVNYGAEIESLNIFRKVLSNPATKMLGRYLLVVGVILDFACTGWEYIDQMKEAEEVKKYNKVRGITIEQKAYFDVTTGGLAGVAGTIAIIGFANEWNPVGRVCTVVAGVLVGVKALGDETIGEINKFQQNYQDFLKKDLPSIKQHIVYVNSRQAGLDSSLQDFFANTSLASDMMNTWKKSMSLTTIADAVKAVIYFEETQKYPYADYDLNREEVRKSATLEEDIKKHKKARDTAVAQRFEYIRKKYIDTKKPIVSADKLQANMGVQALDDILAESRMYQATMHDETYTDKMNVKAYQEKGADELKKLDAHGFASLEKLYKDNPRYFYEAVASLPFFEPKYRDNNFGDADFQKIILNLEFVKKYVAYKMLGKSFADIPVTNFDPEKINHDTIAEFLLSFQVNSAGLALQEITSKEVEYLSQTAVADKYDVSLHMGQNILYEIARGGIVTSHGVVVKKFAGLGYVGKNNMDELKKFFVEGAKEIRGIYYDGEQWVVNENRGSDNEIGTDVELNTIAGITRLREYIHDAGYGSGTGDMAVENDRINIEYVDNFINVIDENLQYRQNPKLYKDQILQYIKDNSNGSYIELDADSIVKGTKAGIRDVGAFVYKYDAATNTFDAKTSLTKIKCELLNPSK